MASKLQSGSFRLLYPREESARNTSLESQLPVIIIAGRIVEIQPRYTTAVSSAEAPQLTRVLRHIWLEEITNRLERFAATKLEEAPIFAEAKRLQTIDILAEINIDPSLAAMIQSEAVAIAAEGLPPDPALARRRVEAKLRASAALVNTHKEEFQ